MELFDSSGKRIAIEPERFRGGEGTVHPVVGDPAVFAKLYHQKIDPGKQAKLAAMTTTANAALLRVAAWPAATLHAGMGGRMVGFLMPRFDGQRSELHDLYRPGTRKQKFRHADWTLLAYAARNVAAAVATVHAAGHVVGDVNQRNFIVGADATVKVLDCDSFQIRTAAGVFRCVVGVPEFTPPELQNRVLDSFDRTANHDAFGLAVLTFQLLFMGRHPFAGRFLGTGDMPIERAIAEGRFAFGAASRARLMEPPPQIIRFDALPPRLSTLFEAAFGGGTMRPTAKQWTDALDVAITELRACASEPMHKYYKRLPACPWCALERATSVYYFIGVTTQQAATFDLGKLWADILASTGLPYEAPPRPTFVVTGEPIPTPLHAQRGLAIAAKVLGSLLLGWIAFAEPGTLVFGIPIFVVMILVRLPGSAEYKARLARLKAAERAWNDAYISASAHVAVEPLQRKRHELQQLRTAYEAVDTQKQNELGLMKQNAREIQLEHFLEQYRIGAYSITDIGPKRKATLAAWGIETAADINWHSVASVQGFGPALQARLMAWRAWVESKFIFDAKRAIPQQDIDAVEYRWRRRKTDLEQQLRAGAEEARRANEALRQKRVHVARSLEAPAQAWAQARADVELVQRELSIRGGTP